MTGSNNSASGNSDECLASTTLQRALSKVAPAHHKAFKQFVHDGTATEEFLNYMDDNPQCQEAAEEVFQCEVVKIKQTLSTFAPGWTVGKELAATTNTLLNAPKSEMDDAIHTAVSTITDNTESQKKLAILMENFVSKAKKIIQKP